MDGATFYEIRKRRSSNYNLSCYIPEVEEVNGAYFADCKVKTPRKQAMDPAAARKLWEISEELTGLNQQSLL